MAQFALYAALMRELQGCRNVAWEYGYTESMYGPYTYTDADMAYIIDVIKREYGRRPTREEWSLAGLPHVGAQYCE